MAKNKITGRIWRHGPQTAEELKRLAEIREKVRQEFPPSKTPQSAQPAEPNQVKGKILPAVAALPPGGSST